VHHYATPIILTYTPFQGADGNIPAETSLAQFSATVPFLDDFRQTRSHPEMVNNMSRVTLIFDLSKIPLVHF